MDTKNSFSILSSAIVEKLTAQNIVTPTKVQDKLIPEIASGNMRVYKDGKYIEPMELSRLFFEE